MMRSGEKQDKHQDKHRNQNREEERTGKINLRMLLGILVFVFGFGVVLYPAVSNLWNQYRQSRLTQSYDQAVEEAEAEDLSAMWEAAWDYNANLTGNLIGDAFEGALEVAETEAAETSDLPGGDESAADENSLAGENESAGENASAGENEAAVEDQSADMSTAESETETESLSASERDTLYQSLLNLSGDGIMGYLSIPKIDVYLPIYHGTGTEELQKGIGHLYGTSLPVGGEGSHTVLAGHRGLPSAALLTDLDLLEEGDYFYLYILDDVLAYQVTSIEVVEPDETDSLVTWAGEDLATIVTCTPYGINTHRLLVHGTRVEYVADMEQEQQAQTQTGQILSFHGYAWMAYGLPAIGIAFVLLLLALLMRAVRKRRERKRRE